MPNILIVEDEPIIRSSLKRLLKRNRHTVDEAGSVQEAVDKFTFQDYDLVISDLRLPGALGTDLIPLTKDIVPVLIMTSYASLKSAVDAIKMGAVDYIAKPYDNKDMLDMVSCIITDHPKSIDSGSAPATQTAEPANHGIIGDSALMLAVFKRINKVAPTDATVLVLGESGTGKELVAKSLHQQSERRASNMVCVNCASIPETLIESELFGHEKGAFTGADSARNGLIEAANGGTLFLDEIGELPLEAQARLLRVLQEGEIRRVGSTQDKKVDVRLVAATHRDLKQMSREGQFREDLYYRLNVMQLNLPPLREREDDVVKIARALLTKNAQKRNKAELHFNQDTLEAIRNHPWPGNVRELENAIERAAILAEGLLITPDLMDLDHPHEAAPQTPTAHAAEAKTESDAVAAVPSSPEDEFMHFVLHNQQTMNETELAQALSISRKCLWERRQRMGIPRRK